MAERPTIRTSANADLICERIADNHTLREIGKEIGCSASKITDWARVDDEFAARYARAMDLRVDRWADEIIEISDDGTNDWIERHIGDGEVVTLADHEHITRSKLRVDTRKWLMSKMMPKKYGERTTIAGDPDAPIRHEMTVEMRQAAAKALFDMTFGAKEKPDE